MTVAQVEVNYVAAADAQCHFGADLEDFARGDVAGDDVAVFGIAFFEEMNRSDSGMLVGLRVSPGFWGTQTRPPSPRADSQMRRHLSSPGIAVGWTWMISGLPYFAGLIAARGGASGGDDGHGALPKINPYPPVAMTTASARKARICMVRISWATMPTQAPLWMNRPEEFPEFVFLTRPSASRRRVCSSRA